jgi:hypothetical protein
MNHYINLLEESEKRYLSAAETSASLKLGLAGGALALSALVYFSIHSMTSTIREAETLSRRWDQIKGDVDAARERSVALGRIQNAHATLNGWSPSRQNWAEVLLRIQTDLPEPRERFQLTRLHFEEHISGLRRHRPGVDDLVHPWVRESRGELRGLISGLGAESAYARLEVDLTDPRNDGTTLFNRALLENSTLQTNTTAAGDPIFLFNFSLNLTPRPILAEEGDS